MTDIGAPQRLSRGHYQLCAINTIPTSDEQRQESKLKRICATVTAASTPQNHIE